jgi:6-phosphogluconolactonase (cycloisomerase 2 family)
MAILMSTRRSFIRSIPFGIAALHEMRATTMKEPPRRIFVGTNNGGTSKGIYTASWDPVKGEIGLLELAAPLDSPTFLAFGRHSQFLYAVSEVEVSRAVVTAYSIDARGQLIKLNFQPTLGGGPTHLSVHPDGRSVFVANYGGGSVTSYRVDAQGALSAPVSHFQYEGSGPNRDRQSKPHAHCASVTLDGKFLLVNDLGLDRIVIYKVNTRTGEITPNDPPFWNARPGSGPRHTAFHPNGRWIYNVNELDSTVDVLVWDSAKGTLTAQSYLSTLPPDFPKNTAFAGEILVSPDGKFVYVGNRRHESIAVLRVDAATGNLSLEQLAPNGGENTRHIAIDPAGKWIVASNQNSGNLVVFSRDAQTGKLSAPLHSYSLEQPMCTVFA